MAAEVRAAEAGAEALKIENDNRARAAKAERLELLHRSLSLISTKMLGCVGREGATMLLTDEKADVVAKAVMIFCQVDVDAYLRALAEVIETEHGTSGDRQRIRQLAEDRVRDTVVAHVVKARGELIGRSLRGGSPAGPAKIEPAL